MGNFGDKLQPAVKTETKKVAIGTSVGVVGMWLVFLLLHLGMPTKVPFDYTVLLGGLGGGIVAVLNFLTMGMTVQKVVSLDNQDVAKHALRGSYSKRMGLQLVWCVVAIAAPCFHFVAGILPLLFPGAAIKIVGIFGKNGALKK